MNEEENLMDMIRIGEVEIGRVVEWTGVLFRRGDLLEASPRERWDAERDWLEPRFWNSETDEITVAIQTFVVRSGGRTILVDTGIGNDKERSDVPTFNDRHGDFLDRLAAAGIDRETVDIVIATHLHPDHAGWNTMLVDGAWVPTFPNARYLISEAEFRFWDPVSGNAERGPHAGDHVRLFEDSVAPVAAAGLVDLWSSRHVIDDALTLVEVPGHTPGSAVLEVDSNGERAFLVGDLLPSPMMIREPDLYPQRNGRTIDNAPAEVVAARRLALERAIAEDAILFPAHFDVPAGVRVHRDGSGYSVEIVEPHEGVTR